MRKDLHKVITEDPRGGSREKSKKYRLKINPKGLILDEDDNIACDDDFGPTFASSARYRQYGHDAKSFGDNLKPLMRYLHSQVGRYWDDVYSEIKNTLPKGNAAIDHVLGHVLDEVATDVIQVGGGKHAKFFDKQRAGWFDHGEITEGLFVHPCTGILCYKEREYKKPKFKLAKKLAKYLKINNLK